MAGSLLVRFRRNLKRERVTRGLSQEVLAARVRVSVGYVSSLESGRWGKIPTLPMIERFARGLRLRDALVLLQPQKRVRK